MATKAVGKIEWGEADLGSSDFMNLEEGSNPVRLITSPYQFYVHWTTDATGAKRKVHCALDDCPLCKLQIKDEKAQARWYISVFNRKTEKPAVLEIGPQIYKQILSLAKKPKWGDPRAYDLDIERKPKGSQPLYDVLPEPKEKLTEEEVSLIKEFNARIDLVAMTASPTAEEVREKVGMAQPDQEKAEESKTDNDFGGEESTDSGSDDDYEF